MITSSQTDNVVSFDKDRELSPAIEQAIRLYAMGQFRTQAEAALAAGCHPNYFGAVLKFPSAKAVIMQVKQELNFRLSALMEKYIDVVEEGLDHADIAVRLAAAKLYQSAEIGTKINVQLTAEDVVKQIMSGTYIADDVVMK